LRGGKSCTGTRERRRLRSGEESDEEGECDRQQHEDREPPALLTLSAGQPACAPRRSTRRGWLLGFAHVATLVAGALVAMSHVHQGCVKRLAPTAFLLPRRPLFCFPFDLHRRCSGARSGMASCCSGSCLGWLPSRPLAETCVVCGRSPPRFLFFVLSGSACNGVQLVLDR
jgi:hypothetical protein